jgi:hypothetical protein
MKKLSLLIAAVMTFAGYCTVNGAEESVVPEIQVVPAEKNCKVIKCSKSKKACDIKKECKADKKACRMKQKCNKKAVKCAAPTKKWDFIQLGFWFDVPSSTINTDVYGVKVGAPFCSGRGVVNGIETAVICGATDNINGLQACIILSKAKHLTGLQFGIINDCEKVDGVQLGVVNMAESKSFQIGIINYIKDNPFPWMPIMNFRF